MLSRQDPRDAVVSVDPPALVEAAEQVNTDLTIGRGVGNAQSSAKRARTVNCSGTAPTSIDSYDKSLHDEMERYFAVPLDQFALDQLTADLGAENDCASGFGTGNASGRSRVLIGIDDSDEKSVLDAQVQKVAMGLVSPLWQHVILVVLSMILVSSMAQDLMRASSSQWIACWIQCADYILLVHNRGIMIE